MSGQSTMNQTSVICVLKLRKEFSRITITYSIVFILICHLVLHNKAKRSVTRFHREILFSAHASLSKWDANISFDRINGESHSKCGASEFGIGVLQLVCHQNPSMNLRYQTQNELTIVNEQSTFSSISQLVVKNY